MGRQLIVTIACICLAAGFLLPQEPGNTVATLALPAGNGSWVIRVFTSGGFSGAGNGDVSISSKGQIICTVQKPACPKSFEIQPIQRLVDKFARLDLASILTSPAPTAPAICNDCINRRTVITWRDATGAEHSHSASWDELTAATIPREIIEIYDAVMALRK